MDERPYILILDDDPADAFLLRRALGKQVADGVYVMVETREQYLEALGKHPLDVIISDSSIMGLTALDAFAVGKARHPGVAFFIFSGLVREGLSSAAGQAGIAAAIEKNRMQDLLPLVVQALKDRRKSDPGRGPVPT